VTTVADAVAEDSVGVIDDRTDVDNAILERCRAIPSSNNLAPNTNGQGMSVILKANNPSCAHTLAGPFIQFDCWNI